MTQVRLNRFGAAVPLVCSALAFAIGATPDAQADEEERPATEEEIVELMKSTFDARELDE